jgi:hypothetical protein
MTFGLIFVIGVGGAALIIGALQFFQDYKANAAMKKKKQ